MRINEILAESLSRVAYHYTNIPTALKIIQSGHFELSHSLGSVEQQYMLRGRPYFLSTTRTRTGGYHGHVSSRGVLFVLDGNWFNRHYKSQPLDYWGNRGTGLRASEAEDRVYSAEPTIPIGGVSAIHVLLDVSDDEGIEQHNKAVTRALLIAAKTKGIPAYFYTDSGAWLQLDTRHQGDVRLLSGSKEKSWYRPQRGRSYLQSWIEMMNAKSQNQLSTQAKKLQLYGFHSDYDLKNAIESLSTDMANARKPDNGQEREDAVKIIRYMQQHRLNTIADFVHHIANKWKAITNASR